MKVIKFIDYDFQHKYQLTEAYDDSNSMRYLSKDIEPISIGKFDCKEPMEFEPNEERDFKVIFFPKSYNQEETAKAIVDLHPDVIHMHGNGSWYLHYAMYFRNQIKPLKLIFSPAGSSCGTPQLLQYFDYIIVNHKSQIKRMKVDSNFKGKIIVRRRSADPSVFYPKYYTSGEDFLSDFIYVAGFVPVKRIDEMINVIAAPNNIWHRNLTVLGDFTRTVDHCNYIKKYILDNKWDKLVKLHPFVPQTKIAGLLGRAHVFAWPNVKPENPETTTNRAIIEALACGMPLLLGERAFKNTEFIKHGENGFLYSNSDDFHEKAELIFKKLNWFRANSQILFNSKFSFRANFIEFYNRLYLGKM